MSLIVRMGDFEDPQVIALLARHLRGMQENSPPGTSYALDLSGLKQPTILFYTFWDGAQIAGCSALKTLSETHGEIKSMRTADAYLGTGVGKTMLTHLLQAARDRNLTRVSLETGTSSAFDAAVHLYRKFGFKSGGVFGDYVEHDANQFFHLDLN